jgi:hypothetical protein
MSNSIFHLYSNHEKEVDQVLDRTLRKQEIIAHFPNPVILYAPPGAGALSFAKTCFAAIGISKPAIMDALDMPSSAYGNIQQSLYTKTATIAYIFKDGHDIEILPPRIPTIRLTHQPISPADIPESTLYISLSPLSESQFQKLFFLFTNDTHPAIPLLYQSSFGNFHGLTQAVSLYRSNIRSFHMFMEEFTSPSNSIRPNIEKGPWKMKHPSITHVRNLYTSRLDMPSVDTMCKTWPQYISNAWRIILPRYSSFARCGVLSDLPEELKCWYLMNQFHTMPAKGVADEHALRIIPQDIKLDSMYDLALYSAYCYKKPREEIDCMFRRIHNAYYSKIRSNKNKITTKTKKESVETARLDLFRETQSWNDKLFRKWTQYTAAFSRL